MLTAKTLDLATNAIRARELFLLDLIWTVRTHPDGDEFSDVLAEWEEEVRECRRAIREIEMYPNLFTVYG